jgi:hypothetical protein
LTIFRPPYSTPTRNGGADHTAHSSYGAVILSFVGAQHWGLAMALPGLDEAERTHRFVWSVGPCLLAWPALVLPPQMGAPC